MWISGDNYMNYTYIIKCADSTLYTGWTNDLDKRIKAHNSGKGAKYTKTRRPVKLVYYEEHETKNEAMSRGICDQTVDTERKGTADPRKRKLM